LGFFVPTPPQQATCSAAKDPYTLCLFGVSIFVLPLFAEVHLFSLSLSLTSMFAVFNCAREGLFFFL
jgi:hypothetical protein